MAAETQATNVTETKKKSTSDSRLLSAIEGSATAMMMCDRDLKITYANPATIKMVQENLSEFQITFPGFNLERLVGSNIDQYHRKPVFQRNLLSNPKNLPHTADIQVGDLIFELNISAMIDGDGNYLGNSLEWSNVTGARQDRDKAAQILSAVDGSSTATMMCDRDLVVTYANPATISMVQENLEKFKAAFPGFSLERLVGSNIDQYHTDPAMQRKLLSDPANLPYTADIDVIDLKFELNISAMKDDQGNYIGAGLQWANVTQARKDANDAARVQSSVDGSSAPTMMCDRDLNITYANAATFAMVKENLADFEKAFPGFDINRLVGSCIDDFHKNPAYQRKMLADVNNLPHSADILVGDLIFELNISAMIDANGDYIGNNLQWVNVTGPRNDAENSARIQSAVDGSATSIMMCDRDLIVTYVNNSTVKMIGDNIREFEKAFPGFNLKTVVGTCIDDFHKSPDRQRRLLADPNNLPYSTDIQVGVLTFELNVSAMLDVQGNYIGNNLEWANVTEDRKNAYEAARIQSAIDGSATSIMMCDRDLIVTYVNSASKTMIQNNIHDFERAFPGFSLERIVGTCIDDFHKNPDRQRRLLGNPNNLPHSADIDVGDLTFELNVSAMLDAEGNYIGNNLEWADVTKIRQDKESLLDTISKVEGSTDELNQATQALAGLSDGMMEQVTTITEETGTVTAGAQQMSSNMNSVSAAAEQASSNINSVAVATEEMTTTVSDIASNAEKARDVTQAAVKNVESASERVDELGHAAKEISKVIEAIVEIAEQTKLLALNATIEAARAGEAGKGFAVVANEVKELAKQTREATADIRVKIENMQSSTDSTVKEIGNINTVINSVNEIVTMIATAVEEQNVTTKDIASNVGQATAGVKEVTGNIVQAAQLANDMASNLENVNEGIQGISSSAADVSGKTGDVAQTSNDLQTLVDGLKE